MEAMACGTPVIASDFGSLPEMIVPGQNGQLFAPGDKHALAECIQKLFADPDYLNGLRYSTRLYYEAHFAAGPNYETLLDIYQSVFKAPEPLRLC
jgi:glycosyltransferase involved in cell wall biosynthesis